MLKRLKGHTGPSALVIAVIALLVALGGAAFAAHKLSGTTIKKGSEPGNRLKNDSVTGKQVNESTLNLPATSVPKTTFGAEANDSGTIVTATLSGTTVTRTANEYKYTFPRSVVGCVPVASARFGGTTVTTLQAGTGANSNSVFVDISGPTGDNSVVVTCP